MKSPRISFRSIRQKLLASVLVTIIGALLASGAALFLYDLHTYRTSSATDLAVQAELLGHATTAALQFHDSAAASQSLAFLKARPTLRRAAVYKPTGEVFASYSRQGLGEGDFPPLSSLGGTTIAGDLIAASHRMNADGEVLGTVFLEADLGMGERIASYAFILVTVIVGALLLSLLSAAWLQAAITRPLIEISAVARRVVEKRDYSVRATRNTEDEIGTLVEAFNEMLTEIQRRTADLESSGLEIRRLNEDLERRVTERTAQLEESNLQLKAASMAKSNFLSMMSHEIRTPMNGVLGMLELLSLSELDAKQRTTLEIVRNSGRSLLRIIDDILDFSKIEAGKLEVRPEVASIEAIIASVVGIYSGNASSKALVLKSSVDERISPAVLVDPLRVQQILNNLVSNAIKFTAKGHIAIAAMLVDRKAGVDVVRISVTDTGIGIPPEEQAALFQPFSQASAGMASNFGGTGLGLSIGQRLATLMGGSIEMASVVGKGTTMSLTLPLEVADPDLLLARTTPEGVDVERNARREAPSVEEAQREGTLVLVVDDHPINRLVLMRQVTMLGYANETAEDGRQALELWKSGRFALVITDCNMPEMDGYQLARALRAIENETGRPRTLVIACTANALRGEAENCFAAGMDDYLAKPVEMAALRAKLHHWLPLPDREPQARQPLPPLLDLSALHEITGGDTDLEREVFRRFLAENIEDVAEFQSAVETRDPRQVADAVHRIKGATKTIGAYALGDVCSRVEAAALANDWAAVIGCLDAFRREVARLNAYLAAANPV
jgi:signal transduction histidine kinase/HPt (histidine-containing phosphotransfer) domain-containing protein/ActR/RegA family two-component response regulator